MEKPIQIPSVFLEVNESHEILNEETQNFNKADIIVLLLFFQK